MAEKIPIIIDGKEFEVEKGIWLIEAIKQTVGFDVPHYCYHPGMSVSGNCRMCLVSTNTMPKPTTSCTTPVTMARQRDGSMKPMEVTTQSAELSDAREAIMEYLLINHPLDCPQCDKAGECDLQNYAYTYGRDTSRFGEEKNIRHTKTLGPTVRIWGNRCIACDRCARFTSEITGTGELSLVGRGDKNVIDVFPGKPLDNPMSLNVCDVCPVGALQSRDFLYTARVWFMDKTESIVPNARGDNAIVETFQGKVKRIRPRENLDVNGYWLADEDRLNFAYTHDNRADAYKAGGKAHPYKDTIAAIAADLRGADKDKVGIAVNAWMTNEELFMVKQLVDDGGALAGATVFSWAKPDGFTWTAKSGWTIEADKNPNRCGLKLMFPTAEIVTDRVGLAKDAEELGVTHMLFFDGIPLEASKGSSVKTETRKTDRIDGKDSAAAAERKALAEALTAFQWACVVTPFADEVADASPNMLPTTTCYEKTGTWTNIHSRVQIVRKAATQPDGVLDDLELLQHLQAALLETPLEMAIPPHGLFAKMSRNVGAYDGLTYATIGNQGIALEGASVK